MFMKKSFCALLVLAVGAFAVFADAFTDAIQDLAVQTACIGQYSMTEAGGSRYDDPRDWYTPRRMAERFAKMSGDMTRTTTFYGICFDYAQFAWNNINQYKKWYNDQGMYENKFWIAGVHDNPNEIQLQYPGTRNDHTTVQNGVYVKYPDGGLRYVKTHRHNNGKGSRATGHAWIWIERADGVQFWVDPTWTDNAGYVVYGYVTTSGEEIQCRPDRKFCIEYPNELNSLPLPPPMGSNIPPSPSANSTDRNEIIKDTGTSWIDAFDKAMRKTFIDVDYGFNKDYIALVASVNTPFVSITNKSLTANQMGFTLDMPMFFDSIAGIIGLKYLRNVDDDHSINGGLFTFDFTRRLTSFLAWYIGVGAGLRIDTMNKENYYAPDNNIQYLAGTGMFAFTADAGLILNLGAFFTKIDVSYDNVLGFSVGAGVGFGLEL